MTDGDCSLTPSQDLQKTGPIVPNSLAARIFGLFDEVMDLFQRSEMFGVPSKRQLELSLLENRVDAAKAIGFCIWGRVEPAKCFLKEGECLAVSPPSLRPLSR